MYKIKWGGYKEIMVCTSVVSKYRDLVERVDAHGEAVNARHVRQGRILRALRCKLRLKRNVVEVALRHVRILVIL